MGSIFCIFQEIIAIMSAVNKKSKILVAMSGGVDSSVAAYLLKNEGHAVVGITMCLGITDTTKDPKVKCCGAEAINDAKKVCQNLDIPHYVLDFSTDLENQVIKNFVDEYINGRTPNPCVKCNEYLKFGKLLEYAKNMGFDYLATGHFARISEIDNGLVLCRPKDRNKDQTYFLYSIKKSDLSNIIFPLSDFTKDEVRQIANEAGLAVASKPQSQDVCFVPDNDYKRFVSQRIEKIESGDIVNLSGDILGKHNGIINYTRGQRGGLGVAVGRPQYVVDIDVRNNKIVVGEKEDLLANELIANNVNKLVDNIPENVFAQIRYGHKQAACSLKFIEDNKVSVKFNIPQEAVTKGQSVVFYKNDMVLGGGTIESYD